MFSFVFKVMENENKLKSGFIECDREKEELGMKVTLLEREKAEQSQTIRYIEEEIILLQMKKNDWLTCLIFDFSLSLCCSQLKDELRQTKCLAAERSDLKAQLGEAGQRASHLERQLMDREAECRELASLRRELENLQVLTQSQEQKVAQSLREAQQTQVELASLEAILALLHLREVERHSINTLTLSFVFTSHMIL